MKNKYSILAALCGLLFGYSANAQWTDVINNHINYEFTVDYNHYFNASSETGNSEPVIRTDVWISTYGWIGEQCHSWSCEPNCYDSGGDQIWWAGGTNFDATWQAWMLSYESDNSDVCNWYSNDDDDWQGMAVLRGGQHQQSIVYPSTDFRPCQLIPYLGNGGTGWLFPDNPHFNQILNLAWRYGAGNESTNPLDFGAIGSGQTKTDINANRSVSNTGNYVDLEYSNTDGQSSADVWYKFTVNEPSQVTISTDHGETDFDTYLSLYTVSGSFVTADDDGGSSTTSLISTTLCAGTYLINAEGYSSNTGLFKISVAASSAGSPNVTSLSFDHTSCPGGSDGYASWSGAGGVSPYTYQFDGSSSGSSASSLGEGTYTISISDACGSSNSQTFSISSDDQTAPIANCQTLVEVNVSQGNTTNLLPIDFDNGSTDDCGIETYSVSPSSLDISNVGSNTVTLTVTDESGNSHSCTSTVYALNNTGIEEEALANSINIYPNPNNGRFNLDLNDIIMVDDASITVFDNLGRVLLSQSFNSKVTQLDLGNIQAGVYRVMVMNDGAIASKSISIIN